MKALLTIVFLFGVCIAGSSCSDNIRSKYPDKQSALEQGKLAEKGWMPVEIPDTSRDISERHNLDVNTGAGRFTFDLGELPSYLEKMKTAAIAPEDVTKVQGLKKSKGSWTFFRVGDFLIGVESTTGEGFWRVSQGASP